MAMGAQLLGAHMSTAKGLGSAVRNGKAIGCTAIQVFTSSPQHWRAKEVTKEMVADYQKAMAETGIECTVSHDSYLIRLSSLDPELREKSYHGLKGEMERCGQYGIPYVVSHMGSYKGQTEVEGLRGIVEATERLLGETPDSVTLLMETTAGQGTDLNYRFEHLAAILEVMKSPARLGVCLDTCHIFVAGYDIRTEETYEKTFAEFDRLVGIDKLKAIHCNDSKNGLGTKKDRHEAIGEGFIGPVGFQCLVNDPRFERVPILLETPGDEAEHQRNLQTLRSYIR